MAGCGSVEYDIFATICGKITGTPDNAPIDKASVTIIPGNSTILTGEDGCFSFTEIDPGQYTVSVTKDGYQANRTTINAVSGETTETVIILTPIPE